MCCFILNDTKVMSKTVLEETYAQFKISYFEIQMRYSVEFSHLAQLSLPLSPFSFLKSALPLYQRGLTEFKASASYSSDGASSLPHDQTRKRSERKAEWYGEWCGVEEWRGKRWSERQDGWKRREEEGMWSGALAGITNESWEAKNSPSIHPQWGWGERTFSGGSPGTA